MKTLAPSVITHRDPTGRKFKGLVAAAYNEGGPYEEVAQRLNDTPGLSDHTSASIGQHITPNKFSNEELPSRYGYRSGYKPEGEDLDRQIKVLKALFPSVANANVGYLAEVRSGAFKISQYGEKFFAIPNWQKCPAPFGSIYSEAVQKVLEKIKETNKGVFVNLCKDLIAEDYLCQLARTKEFFAKLSEEQGDPQILIIAAQFGKRHAGKSVRRSREMFTLHEFGLGAFAIGIMLLTHPERLQHHDELWIDCAGDELDNACSDVCFDHAPYFDFYDGDLRFGAGSAGTPSDHYGSASAFVPQQYNNA